MRVIGHNLIFESIPNEPAKESEAKEFSWTDSDKKEMKYHKGKVISAGSLIDFMKEGDLFYYDQNRAYETVIDGNTVMVTQASFVVCVLDSDD